VTLHTPAKESDKVKAAEDLDARGKSDGRDAAKALF
jgi:hypothetical protein